MMVSRGVLIGLGLLFVTRSVAQEALKER